MFRRWGVDVLRLRLQVLGLLPLSERRLVVLLAVAALASGLLPLAFTLSIGLLVAEIPDVVRTDFDSEAGNRLVWILVVTTGVFASIQALAPVRRALEVIIGRQIDEALRARTLDDLLRPARIAHLEDPALQDHLTLIREGNTSRVASPGGAAVGTVRLLEVYVRGVGGTVFIGISRILVLDEPTASLDVRAEAEFFDRFVELTEGLTTVIISHRFSTVRAASRIVVLDEGQIVEDGSHEELVALGGMYAQMFRLQAGRYRAGTEVEAP